MKMTKEQYARLRVLRMFLSDYFVQRRIANELLQEEKKKKRQRAKLVKFLEYQDIFLGNWIDDCIDEIRKI